MTLSLLFWIKNYDKYEVTGLSTAKGRRRKAILNELELKKISQSCCYNIMRSLEFSYKIARKKHYKSDEVEQNIFKKTSK